MESGVASQVTYLVSLEVTEAAVVNENPVSIVKQHCTRQRKVKPNPSVTTELKAAALECASELKQAKKRSQQSRETEEEHRKRLDHIAQMRYCMEFMTTSKISFRIVIILKQCHFGRYKQNGQSCKQ